jgi:hypothetical protein
MGIAKIFELIKKKSPEAIRETSILEYKGKIIAIDASMV